MIDDALYEVVDGQRVELPSLGELGSLIASRLARYLSLFADERRLGTVVMHALFIFDPNRDLRRRPDVAFVSAERWPLDRPIPMEGDWEIIPDLAVKITNPNDNFEELLAKIHEYFEKGVREVWIVVPRRQQIYRYDSPTGVHILKAAEELNGGWLLPGFRFPLARIFQRQIGSDPVTHI
jgi:Uma2 family endonuclease